MQKNSTFCTTTLVALVHQGLLKHDLFKGCTKSRDDTQWPTLHRMMLVLKNYEAFFKGFLVGHAVLYLLSKGES
jgi:hypothetical protein